MINLRLFDKIKKEEHTFLQDEKIERGISMNVEFMGQGKVIRDAVHGDIFIPNKFLKVIDTVEFQRLRRIKQLSIANMVFPSADHTRFSHSIGTYHIMTLMIRHFEKTFLELGISISEEEKDIVLLAALLHDLGHGPFSHAFEGILPAVHKNILHEEWTKMIIEDEKSDIHEAIVGNFGEKMPRLVTELINKQKRAKSEKYVLKKVDLSNVLSSLISSQLDADRMDYLLRDSKHCGVFFGNIDIQRIISSLEITEQENQYFVRVPEKYVQDIENYVLARFQMQKVVYYHEFKIQMEQLIKQILHRAYDLYQERKLKDCPELIGRLFLSKIEVDDYVQMDDSLFQYAFSIWKNEDDEILKNLCENLIGRNKINKINALDNCDKHLSMMKADIVKLFKNYGYPINDLKKEFFWIENKPAYSAYKKSKENIWIRQSNGIIKDLSEVSVIFKDVKEPVVWENDKNIIFINYNILNKLGIEEYDKLKEELKKIVENYDLRNTIEIEKKYIVKEESVFEQVDQFLTNYREYTFTKGEKKEQVDYYYDTNNEKLRNNNCTLRVREKNGKYELTIKKPVVNTKEEKGTQSERFEFKKYVSGIEDLDSVFVSEYLNDFIQNEKLSIKLIIVNQRTPVILEKGSVKFEMVYDRVKYCTDREEQGEIDFQIEIELKSQYQHRVNLKMFTDELETHVKGLEVSDTSKYKRGLKLIKM